MSQADQDYILALQLQDQLLEENELKHYDSTKEPTNSMSLVDPYWETTDPNPDIRALFLQFNDRFFWGRLAGIEVRWSPRMTLCAGLCCYEGRGGLCSVRLSVPLLKLRPRKDLVETLLHEMIHAYLFVTENNKDHDGHGPEFHKHMYRINKETGTNISVYHNFHDEVDSYRQHWWRCDGACRSKKPFFGYVKRSMNRAPSKNDTWWAEHQRTCGGTYTKIKEPENYGKKKGKEKKEDKDSKENQKESKPGIKSMDIRVFAGNGVTLGGQKPNKQGTSQTATITSPLAIPASTTSNAKDANITVDRKKIDNTSSLGNKSQSKTKSPIKNKASDRSIVKVDSNKEYKGAKGNVSNSNRLPVLPKLPGGTKAVTLNNGKVKSNDMNDDTTALRLAKTPQSFGQSECSGVKKSSFSVSDFSDSDDDILCSVPENDISGRGADSNKEGYSRKSDAVSKANVTESDTDKAIVKSEHSSGDNGVRAMLRKVWGEKSFGSNAKHRVVQKIPLNDLAKQKTSLSSDLKDKLEIGKIKDKHKHKLIRQENVSNTSKVKSKNTGLISEHKSGVILNDRKRPSLLNDHSDDLPVNKRLKCDPSAESMNTSCDKKEISDKHLQHSSGAQKTNPELRENLKSFNHKVKELSDGNSSSSKSDQSSKLFKEIRKFHSSSPEKASTSKSENSIKSPIEKLFDRVREKRSTPDMSNSQYTGNASLTHIVDSVSSLDDTESTMCVNDDISEGEKTQEFSACPVCSENVPTASINEHLDLCLTLRVI